MHISILSLRRIRSIQAALFFLVPALCAAQEAPARKVFSDSVGILPAGPVVQMGAPAIEDHRQDKLPLYFSLELEPNLTQELELAVAAGRKINPKDLQQKYRGSQANADALMKWLKEQGFEDPKINSERTAVVTLGTVDQIQKSLQVSMVRVTDKGVTYNAASNAPSLPREVAVGVRAIIGLQPFDKAQKHIVWLQPPSGAPDGDGAGDIPILPGAPVPPSPAFTKQANKPPYFVSEILKAYGGAASGVTGAGETIAILIDTKPNLNDLKGFWKENQLPDLSARVKLVNVRGVNLPPIEGEETLDVEWSGGVAPGADVVIYATGDLQWASIDQALDRLLADLPQMPGLHQLSISLGLGEGYMLGRAEADVEHSKFLRLAAAGVNVFVSTGDAGSNPAADGHHSGGALQAEYQSSDPAVLGVGGTSLFLDDHGQVASEKGWSSGGGGMSQFFPRRAWQTGTGLQPGSLGRAVPDVSLAADPNTGAFIYFAGVAQKSPIGGTSWSAPVWAGLCALINEARAKKGLSSLAFLGPQLYSLNGKASFHDITEGSNGAWQAGVGHDLVTGLGTPNLAELLKALTQ